jgi:hypothetical protein
VPRIEEKKLKAESSMLKVERSKLKDKMDFNP